MKDTLSQSTPDQNPEGLSWKDKEIFNQLIRNSFDMIVLLDGEGNQRYVSESCERILGYTPDELINIPVIDVMIHPDDQAIVRTGFREIVEETANGGTQYRHRHKDGSWVYLEAFGSNQLQHPLIQSVILNVRDITERKKTEEALLKSEARLRELNATKDRFFSIIGHDLRTPFMSILGLSDLLLEEIRDDNHEGLDEYATMIQNSAQKAFDLFTNLLEWSRAHTGSINFNPEAFDLAEATGEVVELLNDSARQKTITITREGASHAPVIADKAMVQTIMRNLVSNSIKFTEAGGEIEINIEKRDKELSVAVSDNGIGIAPENMDKLFKIEKALSTTGTNNETGTGLGLLLCKEFVEKHDGEIWAEHVPVGSKFVFTLPRE